MDTFTKDDILRKLRAYKDNPDDWVIRYKERIKDNLLHCPELLYALGWKEYENELFDKDGNLNTDGDWDCYFNTAIRPALIIPQTQDESKTILCYTVSHDEPPFFASRTQLRNRDNKTIYYTITFVVMAHYGNQWDNNTQVSRHDLVSSIIRERFNWSNIFGLQCSLTENKESTTDNNYITRTMVFQGLTVNAMTRTENDRTRLINQEIVTR